MFLLRLVRATYLRLRVTLLVSAVTLLTFSYQIIPGLNWAVRVIVALLVAIGTGYTEYQRKNQSSLNLRHKRDRLFDYFCHGYIEELRSHDGTARIMVLAVDRWPVDRWSTLNNIFSNYMENDSDRQLGLNITQGVCGEAVTQKEFVVGDLEAPYASTYRLSTEQLEKTKNLTLVMSMPIKKAKTGTDGKPTLTDEIIGVINIDSQMPNALAFYEDDSSGDSLLRKQETALSRISEIGSYIMS